MFRHHFHRRGRGFLRWPLLLLLSPLLLLVGLGGCNRGAWHDPERVAERVDSVAEDIADDLALRADQRPAFEALRDRIKARVVERAATHRQSGDVLAAEFERDFVDIDRVAAEVKAHLRNRTPTEEMEAIVDQVTAFYKTLDPEQQATVNKKVRRKLRWLH